MYKVLITFDGSPDGCTVKTYEEGAELDHSAFGDDLVEVALNEKWIEPIDKKAEKPADKPQVVEVTIEMIKDGMTVPEMKKALKDAGVKTSAKKEDTLAKLILEHKLFGGE